MKRFDCTSALAVRILLALSLLFSGRLAFAQELKIAAAADLNNALREIATSYEHQSGRKLQITFGSSGNLTTQILNGAPFDLLLSADTGFPQQLISSGKADASTMTLYGRGTLVVATSASVPAPTPGSPLDVLRSSAITKIALANPRHAPYGRAAEAALRSAGIYDAVAPKFVLGENISQTAQFVLSGDAQAGLLALSLVKNASAAGIRWAEVPQQLYPVMNQAGVVISNSPQKAAAAEFLRYLLSPSARSILEKYGFKSPDAGAAK
jgi:molybdate transport system substrate-binding protein